jgi:type II secretory pathway predicted ATPase ExeA
MYKAYYGFNQKPFLLTPNPECLFPSPSHKRALTYLEYGFMEAASIIVLTGEVGTGKTTLVNHVRCSYTDKFQTALITNTNVTPDELLELMLQAFGIDAHPTSKPQRLGLLRAYFSELDQRGCKGLLIIDDAQNLSTACLEEIRMLFSLEAQPHTGLQVFLVGQAELRERLQAPQLISLTQRVGVNFHLAPLGPTEVAEYIVYRIKKAGGSRQLFDAEALAAIAVASGGIPRAINQLCDAALVYGYGYNRKIIDAAIIKQVIADRGGFGLSSGKQREPIKAGPAGHDESETQTFSERISALETSVVALTAQLSGDAHGKALRRSTELERQLIVARRQLAQEHRRRMALQKEVEALKGLFTATDAN